MIFCHCNCAFLCKLNTSFNWLLLLNPLVGKLQYTLQQYTSWRKSASKFGSTSISRISMSAKENTERKEEVHIANVFSGHPKVLEERENLRKIRN